MALTTYENISGAAATGAPIGQGLIATSNDGHMHTDVCCDCCHAGSVLVQPCCVGSEKFVIALL